MLEARTNCVQLALYKPPHVKRAQSNADHILRFRSLKFEQVISLLHELLFSNFHISVISEDFRAIFLVFLLMQRRVWPCQSPNFDKNVQLGPFHVSQLISSYLLLSCYDWSFFLGHMLDMYVLWYVWLAYLGQLKPV